MSLRSVVPALRCPCAPLSLRSVVPALRCPCAPLSLRSVVPALRCPCAPLSLRSVVACLWLACLSLALLVTASDARAGTYVGLYTDPGTLAASPYTGGTYIVPDQNGTPQSFPDKIGTTQNLVAGYGGDSGGTTASCTGAITVSWKWVPASGQTMMTDPPPTQVIIFESCSVEVTVVSPMATGSYDTGMGEQGTVSWSPGGSNTKTATHVRYSVVTGGASVTLPSVNASAVAAAAGNSSSLRYAASISPVFVIPGGAVQDSGGNWNILVGQGCTASLSQSSTASISPFPSALVSTNPPSPTYQWSVTGTTFQDWEPTTPPIGTAPANPQASYFVGGSGPLTNPTAHWYWNDPNNSTETITCTAMVTPPAGQGSAFSVTAKQTVAVQLPLWKAVGRADYMQVNGLGNSGPYLWAGPTAADRTAGQGVGMLWQATVTTPTTPAFGTGSLELIQIVTPNDSYTTLTTPAQSYSDPLNGIIGLDLTYPYGSHIYAESSGSSYIDSDSPGIPLTGGGPTGTAVAASATFSSSFIDYLMYRPPGGDTQWIGLGTFTWSTNGTAAIPKTNNWADYSTQHGGSDAAGTISSSGINMFSGVMGPAFFPSWTTIDVSKHYPAQ